MRECLTELALLDERLPAISLLDVWFHAEPECVCVGSDTAFNQCELALFLRTTDRHVVVRPQFALRQVRRPCLKREELGVLLGDELQDETIEVRQLLAVVSVPPVVRVAIE